MSTWVDLLNDRLSDGEAQELITETVEEFETFLERHPEAVGRVMAILERRLASEPSPKTWGQTFEGLSRYLGERVAYMLGWVVLDPDRISEVERLASDEGETFVRTILGVYGLDLAEAFQRWDELPDNWHRVSREIFFDQLTGAHRLQLKIYKYSGEEVLVEGPPNSMLRLATFLVATLRLTGTGDIFDRQQVQNLVEESQQFLALFTPDEPEPDVSVLGTDQPPAEA